MELIEREKKIGIDWGEKVSAKDVRSLAMALRNARLSEEEGLGRVVKVLETYEEQYTVATLCNDYRAWFLDHIEEEKNIKMLEGASFFRNHFPNGVRAVYKDMVVRSIIQHKQDEIVGHADEGVIYHKGGYIFSSHHVIPDVKTQGNKQKGDKKLKNEKKPRAYHSLFTATSEGDIVPLELHFSTESIGMSLYLKVLAILRIATYKHLELKTNWWNVRDWPGLSLCEHEYNDMAWEFTSGLIIRCKLCGRKAVFKDSLEHGVLRITNQTDA